MSITQSVVALSGRTAHSLDPNPLCNDTWPFAKTGLYANFCLCLDLMYLMFLHVAHLVTCWQGNGPHTCFCLCLGYFKLLYRRHEQGREGTWGLLTLYQPAHDLHPPLSRVRYPGISPFCYLPSYTSMPWSCSGCVGDLVHLWLGLPHVSHPGASELHGGSSGGVHDCGRLPEWGGASL